MKTLRTRMKTLPALPIPDRRQIAGGAIFLWVALSPWVWGFADNHAAVANHVALVFGFAPLALIMVNLRAAAFVTLLGGVWLTATLDSFIAHPQATSAMEAVTAHPVVMFALRGHHGRRPRVAGEARRPGAA